MRLELLSNGYSPDGGRYLEHALPLLADVLSGVEQLLFVPYATRDWDRHTAVVTDALAPLGIRVEGLHRQPTSAVESAEAVFVGGGNAFRLHDRLYRGGVRDALIQRVATGMPYIGTSAGTNVACPSIRTTNDMPIVEPPSLTAVNLVPFQINPHYPADGVLDGHLGETRDGRLAEFLEENDVPVLALYEGAWLDVDATQLTVGAVRGAKLFQRSAAPANLPPGTRVSALLTRIGRFDT